ncbi:MAG: glycosyltransferase family 1 protein [Patescibacteria group bacterium]|nr:glycosyltransferase family 1 protein [Patescibacteria group bacterium]
MRIGIDCRTILNPGFGEGAGVGHYTYYLVKNILRIDQENEYFLYFDDLITDDAILEVTSGAPNVKTRRFPFHEYKKFLPFAYSHILVSGFLGRDSLDVFHAPSGIMPYTYRGKTVITVHDLAIYKHPEWFPDGRVSKSVSTKMLVPKAVAAASRIITVSESTKRDLIQLFHVNPEIIHVIYEGVELPGEMGQDGLCRLSQPIKNKYDIKSEYILSLGTLEPRKNLILVIDALKNMLEETPELLRGKEYLIAGVKGWKFQELFDKMDEINILAKAKIGAPLVRYLGYVPHGDKFPLMACCLFFVFPSLYEGFGLPVLEAMKLGVPVISSNVSSIPEVAAGAAVLTNPEDIGEMKKALTDYLRDKELRNRYSELGRAKALEFSWKTAAIKTVEVYRKLQ